MALMEMILAPSDCVCVNVNPVEFRIAGATKKPSDRATATTPKIQHATSIAKIYPHFVDVLLNEICTALTHREEFANRK